MGEGGGGVVGEGARRAVKEIRIVVVVSVEKGKSQCASCERVVVAGGGGAAVGGGVAVVVVVPLFLFLTVEL